MVLVLAVPDTGCCTRRITKGPTEETDSVPVCHILDAARGGEFGREGLQPLSILFRNTRQLGASTGEDWKFSMRVSATMHQILDAARNEVYGIRTEREPRLGKKWPHGRQFAFIELGRGRPRFRFYQSWNRNMKGYKNYPWQDWLPATTVRVGVCMLRVRNGTYSLKCLIKLHECKYIYTSSGY